MEAPVAASQQRASCCDPAIEGRSRMRAVSCRGVAVAQDGKPHVGQKTMDAPEGSCNVQYWLMSNRRWPMSSTSCQPEAHSACSCQAGDGRLRNVDAQDDLQDPEKRRMSS